MDSIQEGTQGRETVRPVGLCKALKKAEEEDFSVGMWDGPLPPEPPPLGARIVKFGGRKERYVETKGQLLRCFDPVGSKFTSFRHERFYRHWLKRRFDPKLRELSTTPEELAYRRGGVRFASTPDLQWRDEAGRLVVSWLRRSWPAEERSAYLQFYATHRVQVCLLDWKELDVAVQLLDNLDHGRQAMTSAALAGADLRCLARRIYWQLSRYRRTTRAELGCAIGCDVGKATAGGEPGDCTEHLDAALFHLHANGGLQMDLGEQRFGALTVITSRPQTD